MDRQVEVGHPGEGVEQSKHGPLSMTPMDSFTCALRTDHTRHRSYFTTLGSIQPLQDGAERPSKLVNALPGSTG